MRRDTHLSLRVRRFRADHGQSGRNQILSALLLSGQQERAEAVFRADLEQYPRNPRSLFGLLNALEAQTKHDAAEEVRREFEAAWKNAHTTLMLKDL